MIIKYSPVSFLLLVSGEKEKNLKKFTKVF